jgi:hypothetical protein
MAIERQKVLLGYQVQRQKYKKNAETGKIERDGGTAAVRGNIIILIPKVLCNLFDIPEYTPPANSKDLITVIERKAHTRYIYSGIDDTTGRLIDIAQTFALTGSRRDRVYGNSVAIPTSLLTPKKIPRRVRVAFPTFFNLIMISQALGTMIKSSDTTGAKQRPTVFYSRAGARNFIQYGSGTGPLVLGSKTLNCGAWLLATPQAEQNTDNPGDGIPEGTPETISGGGKQKAGA